MRSLITYFVPPMTMVSFVHKQPILKRIAHPILFILIICTIVGRFSLINSNLSLQQQANLINSDASIHRIILHGFGLGIFHCTTRIITKGFFWGIRPFILFTH